MYLSRLLGVMVLVAAGAVPVGADIFVWRDTSGVSHYTNDLANVPPEYRAEAMTVAKDWARAEPAPEPIAIPAAATVTAEPDAATPARDGYEAAYRAGLRAARLGEATSGGAPTGVGSRAPSVDAQSGAAGDRGVPLLVERQQTRATKRDTSGEDDSRSRVPASPSSPFLQGPAGPPPISDR